MPRVSRVGRSLSNQLPWWGFVDERLCITRAGRLLGFSRLAPLPADGLSGADVDRLMTVWSRVLQALGPDVRLWWVVERWRAPLGGAGPVDGVGQMAASKRRAHVAERVREYGVYLVWEFDRGLARRVAGGETGLRWLVGQARSWWRSRRTPHVTTVIGSVLDDVARDVRNQLAGYEARLSTGTRVTPVGRAEAVRVLHRLCNGGQGEWVDGQETRCGLNWRLASRDLTITRAGVAVGDQLVRVWSLASVPGQVVGNCLDGLYGMGADFSAVLGWRGREREGARRVIASAQHHYHQARHSLVGAMGEGGEAASLEDFGAASEVASIGQALVDLQSGEVCFGEIHLSVAVRAASEREFADVGTTLQRVVGGIDGKIVEETHGLPPVWFGRLPGQTGVNPPRRFFVNSKLASALAPIVGPPRGHDRSKHLDAEPLTTFETSWGTPYGYDLFGGSDVGHTLVLGATGSGKSFLINFLLVQALKYDPQVLVLDLGRSYRYLTRFVGGKYLAWSKATSSIRRRRPRWACSRSVCRRRSVPGSSWWRGSSACSRSAATSAAPTTSRIWTGASTRCSGAPRRAGRSARSRTCCRRTCGRRCPGGSTTAPGRPGSTGLRPSSSSSPRGRSSTWPARPSIPTGARRRSGSSSSGCAW